MLGARSDLKNQGPTALPGEIARQHSRRMIAAKAPSAGSQSLRSPRPWYHRSAWGARVPALALTGAILLSLGGGGLVDHGSATALQARAEALHGRWAYMVANGVPENDLAGLGREWKLSQGSRFLGAPSTFWLPGGADTIGRWEAATDHIWAAALSRYRSEASEAETSLRKALGPETQGQRLARLEAIDQATTPLDFKTLRDLWTLEAWLVPVDRRIAGLVSAIGAQVQNTKKLGIRSDPSADVLEAATAYAQLDAQGRSEQWEQVSGSLIALQASLQARIGAAAVTQQGFQHASTEISTAALYGLNVSALQAKVATDRAAFGVALSPAEFTAITADLKQVAAGADSAIAVVLSQTHVVSGVTMIYQNHPLSCEEAATSMALTHQGIYLSQDQILREVGADLRPMYVDSSGRVRWANGYETFVGNVNGSESNYTGLGTFYPPLVRVAKAHGARVLAYGTMSAATIYARVIAGHPVVAFATWDWAWHPRHDYLSFDGQWQPWIGPVYASHVYVVVGVAPGRVLVNDPIRGQYWVSKAAFEAGYSDFNQAIVFA